MQEIVRTLKVPGFGRLAATYGLNELADWCASIALAALVYAATGDALATTALFVANRFLPAFVVPLCTARLDGLPPARTLAAIYVFEAVTLGLLAFSTASFLLVLVVALAFVDGTLAATARALTRSATVALMEPQDRLREGNATLNVVFSISCAGGPVLAGGFVALAGEGLVLAVAALLFVAQALVIIRARELTGGASGEGAWFARMREGLTYVRDHRYLRTMLVTQSFVLTLGLSVQPIYIVYAHESLGVGDGGYGALLAAWGVGMIGGSMLFTRFRAAGLPRLVAITVLVQGLAYLGLAGAPHVALGCAAAVVGGIGNGIYWVSVVTAIQEATADAFQARVAGVLEGLNTAAPGLGFVLGGATAALFDPRVTIGIAGAGIVAIALGLLVARTRAPVVPDAEPAPAPA